jgi:hypothetical protein
MHFNNVLIAIPSRNRVELLSKTLEDLHEVWPYNIAVNFQGYTPSTIKRFHEVHCMNYIVSESKNTAYAKKRLMEKFCNDFEYIIFIDDDSHCGLCKWEKEFENKDSNIMINNMKRLIHILHTNPKIGAIAPYQSAFFRFIRDSAEKKGVNVSRSIRAANMIAVRTSLYTKHKCIWDDSFDTHEDFDFNLQILTKSPFEVCETTLCKYSSRTKMGEGDGGIPKRTYKKKKQECIQKLKEKWEHTGLISVSSKGTILFKQKNLKRKRFEILIDPGKVPSYENK